MMPFISIFSILSTFIVTKKVYKKRTKLNIDQNHFIWYRSVNAKGIDTGGNMVLVGHDGVQHPAIHFPSGGHLLSFLTCLETGLLPKGRLDPPLGIESGKGSHLFF